MRKTTITFLILLLTCAIPCFAQSFLQIENVEKVPLGDYTYQWRNVEKRTPLQGKVRIVVRYDQYFIAAFKDGIMNGPYERYKDNVLVEKGTYVNGLKNGKYSTYHWNGKLESECTFNAKNRLEGKKTTYHQDGTIASEGYYSNSVQNGVYRAYDSSGAVTLEEHYENGVKKGPMKAVYDDYSCDGVYLNDFNKAGDYKETWNNGQSKAIEHYTDEGGKTGIWKKWFKNGTLQEMLDYSTLQGERIFYSEDGKMKERSRYGADGKLEVNQTFYPGTEVLHIEDFYKDGRLTSFKRYYEDGILREEGRYEGGNEIYVKEYYRNQKVKAVKERRARGWGYDMQIVEIYDESGKALPLPVVE